jgi:hypothetical protein
MTDARTGERKLEGVGAEARAQRLRARFERASGRMEARRSGVLVAGWIQTFIVWLSGLSLFGLALLWIADVII